VCSLEGWPLFQWLLPETLPTMRAPSSTWSLPSLLFYIVLIYFYPPRRDPPLAWARRRALVGATQDHLCTEDGLDICLAPAAVRSSTRTTLVEHPLPAEPSNAAGTVLDRRDLRARPVSSGIGVLLAEVQACRAIQRAYTATSDPGPLCSPSETNSL
jgi:hypothetical protein